MRSKNGGEPTKKVFVGGVDPETPESDIMDHFSKFGEVGLTQCLVKWLQMTSNVELRD